ncbi:hypothetical protein [Mesorhizobium sp. J8]|uniref:hypothetical protein n=1 Tax=Mesorhizobium sp. J8 TaxID=2777475 RepID=UPI001938A394|nr:hypothetical protein [Mesorhizobium sp. J8]BCM17809.1 hypothetical protein MJ8_15750 [Mesorhizobium sp. J8]
MLSPQQICALADAAVYVGSGHHKRYPLDYGFERTNPIPTKSLCDMLRPIVLAEAEQLMERGIRAGMVSNYGEGFPKYIWMVDDAGIVYEAKCDRNAPGRYHGYPLDHDKDVRDYILSEWKRRCQ